MEEIKENNTLIEDQQPISYRPDNNSSPGFHITRKGLLFIAVIVMYVAAIGMPFIGNRFCSDLFVKKNLYINICFVHEPQSYRNIIN